MGRNTLNIFDQQLRGCSINGVVLFSLVSS
jgi:hypothetical protein